VFLLSRIKEAHDSGIPTSRAVAIGLERTGRIVTAAALLFAVAIGAFTTSKLIFIKELGLGTALAVLVDASVIRAFLVPSLMGILGELNWWAPRRLRRVRRPEAQPAVSE
jgi:RND superfamily putative drug exporter